jgi:hypothetical protein
MSLTPHAEFRTLVPDWLDAWRWRCLGCSRTYAYYVRGCEGCRAMRQDAEGRMTQDFLYLRTETPR